MTASALRLLDVAATFSQDSTGEEGDRSRRLCQDEHEWSGDRPDGVSTLRRYVDVVWRRKWFLVVPIAGALLLVGIGTARQQERYEATADVLINRQEAATTSVIGQTPVLDDANRTMQTQARLARAPVVVERTLAASGEGEPSVAAFLGSSTVFPIGDFLRFTLTDRDPARAARLVSRHAREYVRFRRELDTAGLARIRRELSAQITRLEAEGRQRSLAYDRLLDREQQLELLTALRFSNVSVVQTATASDAEQVAPRPKRNLALAAGGGLLLGLILVFLVESLGTRPRNDDEVEELLGLRLLGRLDHDRDRVLLPESTGPDADAAHTVRTSIEHVNRTVGARTVMVTSARADEGKSRVAVQVAAAFARAGRRVVLVDLDFRSGATSTLLRVDDRHTVSALVHSGLGVEDVLVGVEVENGSLDAGVESNGQRRSSARLEVVGGGRLDIHPTELLSSSELARVLAALEQRADLVLVDVAPILEAPDAAALASLVDGLVLVVDSVRARGPLLAETRSIIEAWPVARLGFVATDGADDVEPVSFVRSRPQPTAALSPEPEQVA